MAVWHGPMQFFQVNVLLGKGQVGRGGWRVEGDAWLLGQVALSLIGLNGLVYVCGACPAPEMVLLWCGLQLLGGGGGCVGVGGGCDPCLADLNPL